MLRVNESKKILRLMSVTLKDIKCTDRTLQKGRSISVEQKVTTDTCICTLKHCVHLS